MAATITVREALRQASVLLQDTAPQFSRQPEGEMVDWLNEGALFISSLLPMACSRVDAVKLQTGALQSIESIPYANILPGDGVSLSAPVLGVQVLRLICNMGSDGTTEGNAIRLTSADTKDSQNPNWRNVRKGYVDEYIHDPGTPKYFEVSPAVTGNVWVRIAYNAQPLRVPYTGTPESPQYHASGSNTTKIPVADEYAQVLVNMIVARSHMRQTKWADDGKAGAFTEMAVNFINAKVAAVTGQNPNLRKLPFAPSPLGQAVA